MHCGEVLQSAQLSIMYETSAVIALSGLTAFTYYNVNIGRHSDIYLRRSLHLQKTFLEVHIIHVYTYIIYIYKFQILHNVWANVYIQSMVSLMVRDWNSLHFC